MMNSKTKSTVASTMASIAAAAICLPMGMGAVKLYDAISDPQQIQRQNHLFVAGYMPDAPKVNSASNVRAPISGCYNASSVAANTMSDLPVIGHFLPHITLIHSAALYVGGKEITDMPLIVEKDPSYPTYDMDNCDGTLPQEALHAMYYRIAPQLAYAKVVARRQGENDPKVEIRTNWSYAFPMKAELPLRQKLAGDYVAPKPIELRPRLK